MRKLLFFAVMIVVSWLLMQAVHEFGHMLGAWGEWRQVTELVLNPLTISRTDVQPNPHPLIVVWAGPVVGSVLPLAVWLSGAFSKFRYSSLLRFFAGFCLIANGAYIGVGSFRRIGDCGEMLRNGSPIWALWLFGVAMCAIGLGLWNGLGGEFGFRRTQQTDQSPCEAAHDKEIERSA